MLLYVNSEKDLMTFDGMQGFSELCTQIHLEGLAPPNSGALG